MQVMSSAGAQRPQFNPRTDMDNKISAALEAGTISETDATALGTALDSIDSALTSSTNSAESRLDPSEMKSRVDSLIAGQVEAGTLTEEQAAELQALFAQGPSQAGGQPPEMAMSQDGVSGMEGMEGMQGMGGPGGPPPPPPPAEGSETSSTGSDNSSSSTDALLSSIQAFVENLRASLTASSTYTTSASSTASSTSGLIVDQLA